MAAKKKNKESACVCVCLAYKMKKKISLQFKNLTTCVLLLPIMLKLSRTILGMLSRIIKIYNIMTLKYVEESDTLM